MGSPKSLSNKHPMWVQSSGSHKPGRVGKGALDSPPTCDIPPKLHRTPALTLTLSLAVPGIATADSTFDTNRFVKLKQRSAAPQCSESSSLSSDMLQASRKGLLIADMVLHFI